MRTTRILATILMTMGVGLWIGIAAALAMPKTDKPASTVLPNASIKQTSTNQIIDTSIPDPTIGPIQPATASKNDPAPKTPLNLGGTGIPKNITIPRIGINANIEEVGLDSAGRMDVPKQWNNVAWYGLGFKIGDLGSAVLSGHLDTSSGAPAVFFNISKLNTGDEILVTDTASKTYRFKVLEKQYYPVDGMPLKQIFGSAGQAGLNLITCSGTWDRNAKNYSQRVVIYASAVQS